jgi:hypothetical protein
MIQQPKITNNKQVKTKRNFLKNSAVTATSHNKKGEAEDPKTNK